MKLVLAVKAPDRVYGHTTYTVRVHTRADYNKLPTQGVKGRVSEVRGNMMPGPGAGKRRGGGKPLAVPVHVFRGAVKVMKAPDPKHARLVKIVRADKDGQYRLPLPPGRYTAVAEIDGKLYLNSYSAPRGQPLAWTTVKVAEDDWISWDIQDSSKAAF